MLVKKRREPKIGNTNCPKVQLATFTWRDFKEQLQLVHEVFGLTETLYCNISRLYRDFETLDSIVISNNDSAKIKKFIYSEHVNVYIDSFPMENLVRPKFLEIIKDNNFDDSISCIQIICSYILLSRIPKIFNCMHDDVADASPKQLFATMLETLQNKIDNM